MKTATMTYDQHVQEPGADAAEDDVEHHVVIGTSPASGLRLSCMLLTEPFEVAVVNAAQVAAATGPRRTSFPPCSAHARRGKPCGRGARLDLGDDRDATPVDQQGEHHAVDHRRVPHVRGASGRT